MKKFLLILALATFSVAPFTSCTPETLQDEYQTDKDKICPPNDRNCNGIPDDQE